MSNRRNLAVLTLALVALAPSTAALAEERFPGGQYEHIVTGDQDYHVLKVDLCTPGVRFRGTRSGERGQVVSSFGSGVGAAAAINGDFFDGSFNTMGPSMGDGELWGGGDHEFIAPVSFGPRNVVVPHEREVGLPPWAQQVVCGRPTLLDDGALVGDNGDGLCTARHPRTAVGISQDHRTVILVVVDGRRGGAAGMTCDELAGVMTQAGAFDAVNIDGGGSSTMWLANGGVMNQPSDGHERTVANHMAVIATGSGEAVHCPEPAFRGEVVASSFPVDTLLEIPLGTTHVGWVELRNTGRSAWGADTKLAPTPRDMLSPLGAASWLTGARVSAVSAPTAPGEVGRFALPLYGGALGEYTQAFGLVQEGSTWFADDGGPADDALIIHARVTPPPPDAGAVPGGNGGNGNGSGGQAGSGGGSRGFGGESTPGAGGEATPDAPDSGYRIVESGGGGGGGGCGVTGRSAPGALAWVLGVACVSLTRRARSKRHGAQQPV
jgi:hypothetical protein